jgi:hypothetical protein
MLDSADYNMMSHRYYILLCLLLSHCSSTSNNPWREIGSAEFEKRAAINDLHGCVGENAIMLDGFTLGEVSMRVEFAHVWWSKQSDSIIVAGKVVDAMSAEPLAKVTVAFGNIDTVADTGRIRSVAQTVTDKTGRFSLAFKRTTNEKLAFTLLGYLARLYSFNKIFD